MLRLKRGYFLFIFLCLVAVSCSQRDAGPPSASESSTGQAARVKAGYFAPGQLEAHFLKHEYQFGDISQEDYLEDARALLNAPAGKDVLEKTRPNGDVLHYRISTGEFAVMAADGRIRTYFKTDYRYWMRQ
jgi:pyocin large subunit-like protein